jgi:predicted GIY-YIG superfamily endonuclease
MTNIYVITNILSGKQYVGKTIKSVEQRFYEHCKLGSPKNMYIDAAI